MRDSLESRYNNSPFLQQYIPDVKITENYWKFTNRDGHTLVVNGYGANTGIRGTKKQGVRPQIAILDDLLSDKDAKSPTVIADIETANKIINNILSNEYTVIGLDTEAAVEMSRFGILCLLQVNYNYNINKF